MGAQLIYLDQCCFSASYNGLDELFLIRIPHLVKL